MDRKSLFTQSSRKANCSSVWSQYSPPFMTVSEAPCPAKPLHSLAGHQMVASCVKNLCGDIPCDRVFPRQILFEVHGNLDLSRSVHFDTPTQPIISIISRSMSSAGNTNSALSGDCAQDSAW